MGDPEPLKELPGLEPDIFLLPLAVPHPERFVELDPGVISRRIPDFIQQILNSGEGGPAGLLEIQTPPEEGPVKWVVLQEVPGPEEAFELLPDRKQARAVIAGKLEMVGDSLALELYLHDVTRMASDETVTIKAMVPRLDPVPVLRRITERLAKLLDVRLRSPDAALMTANGQAFFKFLEGLDGAALLSGDLQIENSSDGTKLVQPFAEALRLDPRFGLALRTAQVTLQAAMEGERMPEAACVAVLDRCLDAEPNDGEGCVAIAEQLVVMGDNARARRWLEHASRLTPPPPRGLESLGILFANQGETIRARNLWLRGVELDGHPDFFAHLARLAFTDGEENEGWDKVIRGLRRIYERAQRASEWDDDGRGAGVLLRYLVDHLGDLKPPGDVVDSLEDLCGVLREPEDRVDLGLCLAALDRGESARDELEAGRGEDVAPEVRDQAVRALLAMDFPRFERRFARAVEVAIGHRDPRYALAELAEFRNSQPKFWPAIFFTGVALRRMGDKDQALDLMLEVTSLRPGQPDALAVMAELFDERGNPKRALECIEEAIESREEDASLHGLRARFLKRLDRVDEAKAALTYATQLERSQAQGQPRPSRDLDD